MGPQSGHVPQRVATAADQHHGDPEALHVFDTLTMATNGQIKEADTVTAERVGTALQHDALGLKLVHNTLHHRFESHLIACIVNTIVEWEIDSIVLASLCPNIIQATCPREVISVLMKGDGHDSVSREECLFHTVAMVAVNVDVKDALVGLEKLKYAKHTIVHIAKAARLELFRMM